MNDQQFAQFRQIMDESLGRLAPEKDQSHWQILVGIVLDRRRRGRGRQQMTPDESPQHSLLSSAAACASASLTSLSLELEQNGDPGKSAALLVDLARWWTRSVVVDPDADVTDCLRPPDRPTVTSTAIEALYTVTGVGRELADRIQLFALKRPVAPVGRHQQRIFCRHGWLDVTTEVEEWQATLLAWSRALDVDLGQLTRWLDATGERWCGPKPKCAACPLAPLLPAAGAIDPGTD